MIQYIILIAFQQVVFLQLAQLDKQQRVIQQVEVAFLPVVEEEDPSEAAAVAMT